jgi:hypothetical protein
MAYSTRNPDGQETMANSAPVVIASDQTKIKADLITSTATSNTIMQNAVSATGNGTTLDTTGYGVAIIDIKGTFSATVNFEASMDGTNWYAISATVLGSGDITTSTATAGIYRLSVSGVTSVRARVTWASGTSVTVTGRSTNATLSNKVVKLATGSNVVGVVNIVPSTVNLIKGSATATTTASTSLIAAAGSGLKNYINTISIANTGTATALITLQDGSGGTVLWYTIAPPGGGSNITLPVPIATSANTALFFAAGTASTTIYVSAAGFTGA